MSVKDNELNKRRDHSHFLTLNVKLFRSRVCLCLSISRSAEVHSRVVTFYIVNSPSRCLRSISCNLEKFKCLYRATRETARKGNVVTPFVDGQRRYVRFFCDRNVQGLRSKISTQGFK